MVQAVAAHEPWPMPARGYWAFEDLEALPETGARYEIVDGALLVSPSPLAPHQRIAGRIEAQLDAQLSPALWVFHEVSVVIGRSVRVPDAIVADPQRFDPQALPLPTAAVLLLAEVESPSSRSQDRLLKPAEYASAGIPCYLRVELDPSLRVVAHVLRDGRYEVVADETSGLLTLSEPLAITLDLDRLL